MRKVSFHLFLCPVLEENLFHLLFRFIRYEVCRDMATKCLGTPYSIMAVNQKGDILGDLTSEG